MDWMSLKLDDLNDAEVTALKAYKTATSDVEGRSLCFDLNTSLSSGLWPDELTKTMQDTVSSLDAVLGRCPRLSEPAILYRGSGYAANFGPLSQKRKFRTLGYWSASTKKHVAAKFVQSIHPNASGIVFKLKLPQGTSAYNLESLPGMGGHENEILLPRGMLWQIESIDAGDLADLPSPAREKFKHLGIISLTAISPMPRPLS